MRLRSLLLASPVVALLACRAIAGWRDLEYGASPPACAPIVLPSSGAGSLRIVNVGTASAAADFCVRVSGTSSWGEPVFRPAANPSSCASGIAYGQASVPFSAPVGNVDVKAIALGASCDAAATSERDAIVVSAAAVVTVIRMAGVSSAERIVALAEDPTMVVNSGRVRLVNALDGTTAINLGLPAEQALPTTVGSPILAQPIAPGTAPAAQTTPLGPIDADGYLTLPTGSVPLGVVGAGNPNALFVESVDNQTLSSIAATLLAIGNPGDNAHAVRGLYCEDNSPSTADGGADTAATFADCTPSPLATLAVDTWDTELSGAIDDYEAERRSAVMADLAARTSDDIMCVLNVPREDDKNLVAKSVAARFPYVFAPMTTLATPFDDPDALDGGVPAGPTGPPCAGVDSGDVAAVYSCLAAECSTTGDMTGTIRSTTDCISANCLAAAVPIYHSGPAQNACLDCIIYTVSSYDTLQSSLSTCTTVTGQPLAFEGQTPSMIVSRYPLLNTRAYQLPSTGWRRAVLYAEVQLEDQAIDFYCGQLTDQNVATSLDYSGNYGADGTTLTLPNDGGQAVVSGWEMEQGVQVRRAVDFIRANSQKTGHPAIIAGDWHSSVLVVDADGGVVTQAISPEVLAQLDQSLGGAFVRAEPPGFPGECTWCPAPQNPYNAGGPSADFDTPFVYGFPSSSTTEDAVWATNEVPIAGDQDEPPPQGGMGPPSFFYAKQVRIIRPPVPVTP